MAHQLKVGGKNTTTRRTKHLRKSWPADRRGPRLLSAWQMQYLEHPERVLARLVTVGRGFCLRGRRSTGSTPPWSRVRVGGPGCESDVRFAHKNVAHSLNLGPLKENPADATALSDVEHQNKIIPLIYPVTF